VKLSSEDLALLESLEERLEEVIQSMDCPDGVFVKLSTRSPKDSCLWTANMEQVGG
jgi:hypothetical protein